MSMKTIKEWAELCSIDIIREWWIENAHKQNIFHWSNNTESCSMSEALIRSFNWHESPQGSEYWSDIADDMYNKPEKYLRKRKAMFHEYEDN